MIGNFAHVRIAAAKCRNRVVRRGEFLYFAGAFPLVRIDQYGGYVIRTIGLQPGNFSHKFRVGGRCPQRSTAQNRRTIGWRRNQVVYADRSVVFSAYRPVDCAAFIGGEDQLCRCGCDVAHLWIPGENARRFGGFLRQLAVHYFSCDIRCIAGTHNNRIGKHGYSRTGSADDQRVDISFASDAGSCIQIQGFDSRIGSNFQARASSFFVDGQGFHRTLGNGQGRAWRAVHYVFQIARQGKGRPVFAFQINVAQATVAAGAVFQVCRGAEYAVFNASIAVDADRNKLIPQAVDDQIVGSDMPQRNAGVALLTFTAAGNYNAAQHFHIL